MALKLGKCRLCLKLGDFYSIFTVDNAVQLADMVMECSRVKVYEGDGLPDKVCSECIQKLSSAYIFKQQCERADQELRRNYVPPPGFSISPPPPNRQSSDSAFSNHTDSSNLTKPPSTEGKVTPIRSARKRSIESDNASVSSRNNYTASTSKRIEELKRSNKKPRFHSANVSQQDSDYDDVGSIYLPEGTGTDSDEQPLLKNTFKCMKCPKEFQSVKSLGAHSKVHKKTSLGHNAVVNIPNRRSNDDSAESNDKLYCEKCDKTFRLKIMLKRHQETCGNSPDIITPKKELLVSLEPIDAGNGVKIECDICSTKFKSVEYLRKHMRLIHAVVPKQAPEDVRFIPCLYCTEKFTDYYTHNNHFSTCLKKTKALPLKCPLCDKVTTQRSAYILHVKCHFVARARVEETEAEEDLHECRICGKKLDSQEHLITHLAAHVSNIDGSLDDGDSRVNPVQERVTNKSLHQSTPGNLKCDICDKKFTYNKALQTHKQKHFDEAVKMEPPVKDTVLPNETYRESDSESSVDGEDNTCDICEKQFSYRRLLVQHKRIKHNMCSGTKRSRITLKECPVKCLICDVDMKVSNINEHNQKHIALNMKPRNIYTCKECGSQFKSCSTLATHIKFIHRLKKQVPNKIKTKDVVSTPDLADFCEVVVTKAEPLDWIQSHSDFGEVPIDAHDGESKPVVDMAGFTCPICGKKMPTLISLKRHVNWHTNVGKNLQKVIECFVCKEKFRFQCHYKIHMREHYHDVNLDPKILTCSICNRRSKHLRAAVAHMNYHKQTRFQNKDYQCSICKRVFQFRKVYLSHMAIHYKKGDSIQNTVVGCVGANVDNNVNNDTHTCNICGKVCDSENSLKHHKIWHKSKTSLYGARHECEICNLQFTSKKWLEMHKRTHYEDDNGPFKCIICGKGYTSEVYYRRHIKSHNFDNVSHKKRIERLRKNKVKCPICNRYYPDLVKLIRHLRRTHPESKMIKEDPDAPPQKYYACKLCAKVFLNERRYQHHEEAHLRKPEFFKCKFCGKKTISLKNHRVHIKAHLTTKHIENPLKCPHCEEVFVRGYDLHHHLRDVHDINETWIAERTEQVLNGPLKDLQCSVCFKILASQGNFQRHIDYHNSLRCNYCFDYFSALRFLEGHLAFACEKKQLIGNTEIYPKKVKCHICYKAFHLQVKLDCHLRTQHDISVHREASSGKKEITCDYCFKVFENEYALTTHKIYHRTIGHYGCIYCKKKFNSLTLYRKHKNAHLSQLNVDNPTKCEHCEETFVAFREFIYHMRDIHGDDKEWVVMPKDAIEETCPICNKVFLNLHKHLNYHEENKCKKCNEYFYSTIDFDNHLCAIESDDEVTLNIADGKEQKYEECRFCFKPITKKNSKRLHDQIHKGSGSISCRFCPLKFKTMDAFNIHAFSHRSRKYNKRPIKCRKCGEKFIKYGPFMSHMKLVHKSTKKVHYRTTVKPEKCRVCGDEFPNLHNHYRAHLLNQCKLCQKYFTSYRIFSKHECDKEESDSTKVFTCDENLTHLINTYVPKDEKDDEKFYGYSDEEEEETAPTPQLKQEEDHDEKVLHDLVQSPIISDVLSLFRKEETKSQGGGDCISQDGECNSQNSDVNVVNLTEDDSVDINDEIPIVVIDDD